MRIDTELSQEVVHFIATQSMRSAVPRTRGRIEDLVRETCGHASPNNLQVFTLALADQGATVEGDHFSLDAEATLVPACLPDETQTRIVGRLPGQGDNFYTYFKKDLGVELRADADIRPRVSVNRNIRLDGHMVYVSHRAPGWFDIEGPPPDDHSVDTHVIAQARDQLIESGVDPLDSSRVAFESLVTTNTLIAAGVDLKTSQQVVEHSLTTLGVPDTDAIWNRVDAALATGQQEPRIRDMPIMADYCRGPHDPTAILCDAPAAGAPVLLPSRTPDVVTSLNARDRAAGASRIYAHVPVLSVEQTNKSAEVLLASVETAPDDVQIRDAPAETITEDSDLTRFMNVQSKDGKHCRSDSYRNWTTPEFQQNFRAELARAVEARRVAGDRLNNTHVLVLDGGFFRFDTQAFGKADWDSVLRSAADSTADSLDGMADSLWQARSHGTVVAGLALGGPDLMDSFSQNGIPVSLATNAAYRVRGSRGSERYVVQENLPALLAAEGAHIVNLSVGALNEEIGKLHMLQRTLLNRTGPLFVVAAGNNGNNDAPHGQSVTDIRLMPQSWGAGDSPTSGNGAYNVLVVAALDGDGEIGDLAWFSNFGKQHVYLAAPGCEVKALAPTAEADYQLAAYNGTSYAAPIVSFVAAAVHALMPRGRIGAPWVRARLLSTADIEAGLDSKDKVRNGRILNPVAAVRVHEDVLTLTEPLEPDGKLELAGRLLDTNSEGDFEKGTICTANYNERHRLLRLFHMDTPGATPRRYVDLINYDAFMQTQSCALPAGVTLRILVDGAEKIVPIEKVADIRFAVVRGD